MKFSFEQLKTVTFGYVRSYEDENGMHFDKCTEKQVAAFSSFWAGLGQNACATTGIRLDFHTDSDFFKFTASSGKRFELYLNGVFRNVFIRSDDENEFFVQLDTSRKDNRITLYLPSHDAPGVLSCVEIADGASFIPHRFDRKFFFIGDSITQGWDSHYDSLSYANRVSDFFNAESIIQGAGGAFFSEKIFDPDIDFDPDIVIFAFGTNDWGFNATHEDLRKNTDEFISALVKRFEGKKIFGISPIWRGNTEEPRATGYFKDVCSTVKKEIVSHGVTLIEGEMLTPHMEDFFADKYLHPNGLGFGIYAHNLCKILKEYID